MGLSPSALVHNLTRMEFVWRTRFLCQRDARAMVRASCAAILSGACYGLAA
jgi:hypothetical protein